MATQAPFTLTVTGRAEIPYPAERGLIHVNVSSSGSNKAAVSDEVITTTQHIESLLSQYCPQDSTPEAKKAAPLAHWSKTSLSATSFVPGPAPKGPFPNEPRPREFQANIKFDIRFRDFKALGAFGTKLTALPHVEVQNMSWMLTSATEKSYRSQLRQDAAKDAFEKARDYCQVLGCVNLRPVELFEGRATSNPFLGGGLFGNANSSNLFGNTNNSSSLFGSVPDGSASNVSFQTAQAVPQPSTSIFSGQLGGPSDVKVESELEFKPQEIRMNMEVSVKFMAEPTTLP